MTSRFTPTVKSSKPTTAKFSTPSSSSTTTPIKPARATLSTTKKLSAVARPTLVKQTSACDLRERLHLNQNDDVLNTAFSSSPFISSAKLSGKSKTTTPSTFSASTNSLTGTSSGLSKGIASIFS